MARLRVAVVQAEPVLLNAARSLDKAVGLIEEASRQGARFVLFPETFVPGYAQWAHDAAFEHDAHKRAYQQLVTNSVRVPDDLGVIAEAARSAEATVVLPVTERLSDRPGSLYNTFAVFSPDGSYLGKHRKLRGTHHERTVYMDGDGDTLRAFEVDGVRFGGLLCWNNFMPLARHALYQQGILLYLAPTADDLDSWQTAMQFIARESRSFVLSAALLQRKASFPEDWPLTDDPVWAREQDWNERGGSCIVGPSGDYLAGPVYQKETVLVAEIDTDDVIAARHTFDAAGHYARPEVLHLDVRGLDPLR